MIQQLLKTGENIADVFGAPKVGDGIGQRVVVSDTKQRIELVAVEFADAGLDIMGQHEVQKNLLLVIELQDDAGPGLVGALLAGERRQGVGDVGK